MSSISEDLRKNRLTIGEQQSLDSKHLVVLGLHESSRYRNKIMTWLPRIDFGQTSLVIIDNHSVDDTWNWARELIDSQALNCKLFLIRNQMNYGGFGTLASNLDLLNNAEWITTLHQDDKYEPNHIRAHSIAISNASEKVGIVSSEAVSVDENGKKLGYPKAAWLLGNNASPVDVFLAHLKLHALPFSGASFRTNLLNQVVIPWHSTAFPDTELVMRAASTWSYKYLEEPKVQYFENPTSESHLLADTQREYGAYLALVRVFRDSSFMALCKQVDKSQLEAFITAVQDGVLLRIKNNELRQTLQIIAQEALVEAVGPNRYSSKILGNFYSSIGDVQATRLLDDLAALPNFHRNRSVNMTKLSYQPASTNFKTFILKLAGVIPRKALKFIFSSIMKTKLGKRLFPSWDFKWTKK